MKKAAILGAGMMGSAVAWPLSDTQSLTAALLELG